jgi:hypothetical protein
MPADQKLDAECNRARGEGERDGPKLAPTNTAASRPHQSAPRCCVISVRIATTIRRAGASTVGLVTSVMIAAARYVRAVSGLPVVVIATRSLVLSARLMISACH